jgi:hypothetical protein
MHKFYRDLFETSLKSYKFVYNGQGISLNAFYSSNHWSGRTKILKQYHPIFHKLIEEQLPKENIKAYSLIIFYNSKHDPDNVIGTGKVFVDVLRGNSGGFKYIEDDTKEYCKFVGIVPDESLRHNTFEINLIIH